MSDITKFWLVWNDGGRTPTRKHWSKAAAREEADRLANNSPGQVFVVLSAIDAAQAAVAPAASVRVVKRAAVDIDEEIPF